VRRPEYLVAAVVGYMIGWLAEHLRRETARHTEIAYDHGFIAGLSSRAVARAAEGEAGAPTPDRPDPLG
jgi:hypothetical protein